MVKNIDEILESNKYIVRGIIIGGLGAFALSFCDSNSSWRDNCDYGLLGAVAGMYFGRMVYETKELYQSLRITTNENE